MIFKGVEALIIISMVAISLWILWAKYKPKPPKAGCATSVCNTCQGCALGQKHQPK